MQSLETTSVIVETSPHSSAVEDLSRFSAPDPEGVVAHEQLRSVLSKCTGSEISCLRAGDPRDGETEIYRIKSDDVYLDLFRDYSDGSRSGEYAVTGHVGDTEIELRADRVQVFYRLAKEIFESTREPVRTKLLQSPQILSDLSWVPQETIDIHGLSGEWRATLRLNSWYEGCKLQLNYGFFFDQSSTEVEFVVGAYNVYAQSLELAPGEALQLGKEIIEKAYACYGGLERFPGCKKAVRSIVCDLASDISYSSESFQRNLGYLEFMDQVDRLRTEGSQLREIRVPVQAEARPKKRFIEKAAKFLHIIKDEPERTVLPYRRVMVGQWLAVGEERLVRLLNQEPLGPMSDDGRYYYKGLPGNFWDLRKDDVKRLHLQKGGGLKIKAIVNHGRDLLVSYASPSPVNEKLPERAAPDGAVLLIPLKAALALNDKFYQDDSTK